MGIIVQHSGRWKKVDKVIVDSPDPKSQTVAVGSVKDHAMLCHWIQLLPLWNPHTQAESSAGTSQFPSPFDPTTRAWRLVPCQMGDINVLTLRGDSKQIPIRWPYSKAQNDREAPTIGRVSQVLSVHPQSETSTQIIFLNGRKQFMKKALKTNYL